MQVTETLNEGLKRGYQITITAGELDEKKLSDPLLITRKRLLEDFGRTEDGLEAIKTDVYAEAQGAWDFAESSPKPDTSKLYDYIYSESN